MISGVDEAGRGPVFGPLVIAGVSFKDENNLRKYGIKDSKQLTPKKREELSIKIKKICLDYKILVISARDIDDMRKVMTLNEIEVNGFSQIIKKLKPKICYVDSVDVNEKRFGRTIQSNLTFKLEIISEHKADEKYAVVGAASIIAKTKRDEIIKEIEKELTKKLNKPLGSGYPADPITQDFLHSWFRKYGKLPPYVRHSWKTSKNILNQNKIKKLEEF